MRIRVGFLKHGDLVIGMDLELKPARFHIIQTTTFIYIITRTYTYELYLARR